MTPLERQTLNFWHAAVFRRRAPERDQSTALKALSHVLRNSTGTLHERAATLLKEFENEPDR